MDINNGFNNIGIGLNIFLKNKFWTMRELFTINNLIIKKDKNYN